MQLVITVYGGRISPVFDGCRTLRVITVDRGRVEESRDLTLGPECEGDPAVLLETLGVRVLLCGGISALAAARVRAAGTEVVAWLAGPVDEVLQAYLEGRLPDPELSLPGCGRGGGRRSRCRGGRGRQCDKGGNHAGSERNRSHGRRPPDR